MYNKIHQSCSNQDITTKDKFLLKGKVKDHTVLPCTFRPKRKQHMAKTLTCSQQLHNIYVFFKQDAGEKQK